jgi:hypothetical protein
LLRAVGTQGYESINMGGAETRGLFEFKKKFSVVSLRPSFDAGFLGKLCLPEPARSR